MLGVGVLSECLAGRVLDFLPKLGGKSGSALHPVLYILCVPDLSRLAVLCVSNQKGKKRKKEEGVQLLQLPVVKILS